MSSQRRITLPLLKLAILEEELKAFLTEELPAVEKFRLRQNLPKIEPLVKNFNEARKELWDQSAVPDKEGRPFIANYIQNPSGEWGKNPVLEQYTASLKTLEQESVTLVLRTVPFDVLEKLKPSRNHYQLVFQTLVTGAPTEAETEEGIEEVVV